MPERPDVTVYVEALRARITGARLEGVRLAQPFVLRSVDPPIAEVTGRAVAGVRRDVRQLITMQSDVERMQHEPARGHAVIRLEMARVVPAERGDAIAALDAELSQAGHETTGALEAFAVVVAKQRAIRAPAHDFLARIRPLGVAEQRRERKRIVHHEAMHTVDTVVGRGPQQDLG